MPGVLPPCRRSRCNPTVALYWRPNLPKAVLLMWTARRQSRPLVVPTLLPTRTAAATRCVSIALHCFCPVGSHWRPRGRGLQWRRVFSSHSTGLAIHFYCSCGFILRIRTYLLSGACRWAIIARISAKLCPLCLRGLLGGRERLRPLGSSFSGAAENCKTTNIKVGRLLSSFSAWIQVRLVSPKKAF